jgi:23S rRNA (pseudouridine1915-N3)-methyltransferase
MKIKLIVIAKTDKDYLKLGMEEYLKRLKHYCNVEYTELNSGKKYRGINSQKDEEGTQMLKEIDPTDILVLLDENGQQFSSLDFSKWIAKRQVASVKKIVFVIGGPYGFSDSVYARANSKISLSQLTFSHQMVRLFFLEQLYRAFTIIKGEKYHHE